MKITRSWLKAAYGKKCKDYDDNCCVCRVWFLFEQLEQYYNLAQKPAMSKSASQKVKQMVSKHDMETNKTFRRRKIGMPRPKAC